MDLELYNLYPHRVLQLITVHSPGNLREGAWKLESMKPPLIIWKNPQDGDPTLTSTSEDPQVIDDSARPKYHVSAEAG